MNSQIFTLLFIAFLLASLTFKLWLSSRHIRHILQHRAEVPAGFSEKISLEAHQKAADYTISKTKFGIVSLFFNTFILLGFTLFGGLNWLAHALQHWLGDGLVMQLGLLASFSLISGVLDLPFAYYSQFRLEANFGFNNMKPSLFWLDTIKVTGLLAAFGLPLCAAILWLMGEMGELWWLYAWLVWTAFQLFIMMVYPNWIAPLFNKFTPLEDQSLVQKIEGLMQRVGFASKGLFVMDGSKRSGHSNALFSGIGNSKRIVFFDTLINRLSPDQMEAVLAHELGHFRLNHIKKGMAISLFFTAIFFITLGILKQKVWFYTGLGVNPIGLGTTDALALLLFMQCSPVFLFMFSPLMAIFSRKNEFEADAFAAKHTRAQDLIDALMNLYENNASTLTPDPLHSAIYDSHPPASLRIQHLLKTSTLPS